jgi:hypothetical protein
LNFAETDPGGVGVDVCSAGELDDGRTESRIEMTELTVTGRP